VDVYGPATKAAQREQEANLGGRAEEEKGGEGPGTGSET
jgi:hypothetical protein